MCLFNMKTVGSSKSSLDLQGPCETTAAHLAHPLEGEGGDAHPDHGSMDTHPPGAYTYMHTQTWERTQKRTK